MSDRMNNDDNLLFSIMIKPKSALVSGLVLIVFSPGIIYVQACLSYYSWIFDEILSARFLQRMDLIMLTGHILSPVVVLIVSCVLLFSRKQMLATKTYFSVSWFFGMLWLLSDYIVHAILNHNLIRVFTLEDVKIMFVLGALLSLFPVLIGTLLQYLLKCFVWLILRLRRKLRA